MSLSAFVLFTLGILAELIFLAESSPEGNEQLSKIFNTRSLPEPLSPARTLILLLVIIAIGLVGLFEFSGNGQIMVYIDTPIVSQVMILLALFVLASALLAGIFTPPVTEQAILVVQALVLAGVLFGGEPVDWLPAWSVTVLPVVVGLLLLLWPRVFPAPVKAVLYLWYLLSLLAIPFQSGEVSLINQADPNWPEAYTTGMLMVFLAIHGLLAARFLIITLSILRKRNRVMVAAVMPQLFSDEQTPPLRALAVVGLLAGLLWANHQTSLLTLPVALSLCSLLAVQLMTMKKPQVAEIE